MIYKRSSITTLINKAFILVSSYASFHKEIMYLRQYFTQNFFPVKLFNAHLCKFLNNKYSSASKPLITVSRHTVYMEVPYIGYETNKMMLEIKRLTSRFFPQLRSLFYSRNQHKLSNYFQKCSGDPSVLVSSNVIYKYTCDSCQLSYVGSTILQMFMRIHKHKGTSFRTNRYLTNPEESAIRAHCHNKDHLLKTSNFSIIGRCNRTDVKLLESLHIIRLKLNNFHSAEK